MQPSPLERLAMSPNYLDGIPDGNYLKTRGWFTSDKLLQEKVKFLVAFGYGEKVNVLASNFSQHVEELMRERWNPKM
jgi:hypothetical protein